MIETQLLNKRITSGFWLLMGMTLIKFFDGVLGFFETMPIFSILVFIMVLNNGYKFITLERKIRNHYEKDKSTNCKPNI